MIPQDDEFAKIPQPNDTSAGSPQENGLSSGEATDLLLSRNDPNAADMDNNGDAAKMRQLTGELPGSASAQNPGGLPSVQDAEFEEGT